MTPKERIAMKEAQARKTALKKKLSSLPAVTKLPVVQEKLAILDDPKSTSDALNDAMDVIDGWLNNITKPGSTPKPTSKDSGGEYRGWSGWRNYNDYYGWKDVSPIKESPSRKAKRDDPDFNKSGVDSCLIRIMIPKRKGTDVMHDIDRIEKEIGALSHNITMVIGEISGEIGSHWAVDFTVEWDFAYSASASDRFIPTLVRNIERNVDGIGSVKLV